MMAAAEGLRPQQPQAEQDDRRVARDLDPVGHAGHLLRRGADDQRRHADDDDRRQRLDEGRGERDGDAALHRVAGGEHVGGDHRLAVARARRRGRRRRGRRRRSSSHTAAPFSLMVAERAGERSVELRLAAPRSRRRPARAGHPPIMPAAAVRRRDAERALAGTAAAHPAPRRGRRHVGRRAVDGEEVGEAVGAAAEVRRQLALVASAAS